MLKVPLQPKFSEPTKAFIKEALSSLDTNRKYYWFSSSGSTLQPGQSKWIALTEKALVVSARSVNEHLQVEKGDVWVNPLPLFHVGGFAISVRAQEAKVPFYNLLSKWDSAFFCSFLEEKRATLTSLVPAQVYDIVSNDQVSPPFLRAAIVGGGHLDFEILKKARALGWPILSSYGMTELASQVATASLDSLKSDSLSVLTPLSHVKWQKKDRNRWSVLSESLFSKTVYLDHLNEEILSYSLAPKGFLLPDLVEKTDSGVRVLGREDGVVKILGELVNVQKVCTTIERVQIKNFPSSRCAVVCHFDKRLGTRLVLFTEVNPIFFEGLKKEAATHLLPFEVPNSWHYIDKIPLSPLGKPLVQELELLALSSFDNVSSSKS